MKNNLKTGRHSTAASFLHSQFPSPAPSFLLWAPARALPPSPGRSARFSGTPRWARDSPGCPLVPMCCLHCNNHHDISKYTNTEDTLRHTNSWACGTHSVKPFHLRKYSTLPLKILRRMIFSTTNSWTTAVSSVFLCLAVCFFLILTRHKHREAEKQQMHTA